MGRWLLHIGLRFAEISISDFEGEKYCGEGLIWYKIALHYKLRYFAHPIILTEYYPDGLTALGVNKGWKVLKRLWLHIVSSLK